MPRIPFCLDFGIVLAFALALLSRGAYSQFPEAARRPGLATFIPLDLQSKTNHKCKDSFQLGRYAGNTLASLPNGKQNFQGITFRIGDGVIQLGSTELPNRPAKVAGIPVGTKFSKLHVLHATAYSDALDRCIGTYTVHYDDGTSAMLPILFGKDVLDWWKYPGAPEPTRGRVAWQGENEGAKQFRATIRLYLMTWENPHPGKTVTSIDYASTMTNCAPFCVAITAERALQARASNQRLTADDLQQLWAQLVGDAGQAANAVETFAGVPQQAIPFLRAQLRAVQPAAVEKRIGLLITQLENDDASVREKACSELEKLGREALPQLQWSLVKAAFLQVRHRIEPLVEKAARANLTPDQTRLQRVLQVFELIATSEACRALKEAAKGSAGAWLATEAEASLQQLRALGHEGRDGNNKPEKDADR